MGDTQDKLLDEYADLLEQAAGLVRRARREPDASKRADIMERVSELSARMTEVFGKIYPA